ncbi:MAG: hypothetical protein WC824_06845 [Bacteroidota bacterium]|jgi:hypothetical protein
MHRITTTIVLFIALTAAAWSQSYESIITGDYVRKHFKLKQGEVVKYEDFKKTTFPTATVVWGTPEKSDAERIKAGVAPAGSKLLVVFTDLKDEKEYDRIPSTYKDGVVITGVGRKAVWSEKWKQISVLLTPKLLVHIHLDHPGTKDLKAALIAIARDIDKKIK